MQSYQVLPNFFGVKKPLWWHFQPVTILLVFFYKVGDNELLVFSFRWNLTLQNFTKWGLKVLNNLFLKILGSKWFNPFTPEPPVQIHVPSTTCGVISFNGQGQLCPLMSAEWRDLSNHTRMSTIQSRTPENKAKNHVTLTRKLPWKSCSTTHLGLDTNITKNRLNMFPEIPDFFPNISKFFSKYLESLRDKGFAKSRRQIYELIGLRYKICRIASLWYLFNSVLITNFSHTRSKASLIVRILRSGSGYVLQKSVNGLWLVNVNVGCV